MNRYFGRRLEGGVEVEQNGLIFDPSLSQKIRNHSPDGPNWGYGGSGPAQLALMILLEELPAPIAIALYQTFKAQVISSLPHENWSMISQDVFTWIAMNLGRWPKDLRERIFNYLTWAAGACTLASIGQTEPPLCEGGNRERTP